MLGYVGLPYNEVQLTKGLKMKYSPFKKKPDTIYEKDSFKIVIGETTTNPEEKLCIGLNSDGFPAQGQAYVIFPPQLSIKLLISLWGEEGAENERIKEAIRILTE